MSAARNRGRPVRREVEAWADMGPTLKPDPDLPDPGRLDRLRAKAGVLVGREIAAGKQQQARAARAMAVGAASPDPITRHNHGVTAAQIANGRARLGVLRPDPDRPMLDQSGVQVGYHETRGARAVILYDWLHSQGMLTDEQREAADRYLVRLEQASGAREGSATTPRGLGGDLTACPTEWQVRALADLRHADAVLGHDRDMVREVVGWNREPDGGLPLGQFQAALGRLAASWGM